MDFIEALNGLKKRRMWVLIGLLPALYLALSTAYHVGPSGLHKKNLEYGAASTSMLVDSAQSTLVQTNANVTQLSDIAQVYGEFYNTPTLQADIASRLGVSPNAVAITVESVNPNLPTDLGQNVGQRNTGLLQESNALQLVVVPEPSLPLITLEAQGPNGVVAANLADAGAAALKDYVSGLPTFAMSKAEQAKAAELGVTPPSRVTIRQLGPARGGMVDSGANTSIVVLAFVALAIVDCFIVIMLGGFIDRYRAARRNQEQSAAAAASEHGVPAPAATEDDDLGTGMFDAPDDLLSGYGSDRRRLLGAEPFDQADAEPKAPNGTGAPEADGEIARRAGLLGRLANALND